MFIKKDLRKIPRILEDAPDCPTVQSPPSSLSLLNDDNNDNGCRESKRYKKELPLSELRLGRRKQEFVNGSIQILCQPKYLPKLLNLQSLNLYDCGLTSTTGIGLLGGGNGDGCPNLTTLNLGRNPLQSLSNDIANLASSLKNIWLDDCQINGKLPDPLLQLTNLESLRMPNNSITDITGISKLTKLKLLCLDNNQITYLPTDEGTTTEEGEGELNGGYLLPDEKQDDDDDDDGYGDGDDDDVRMMKIRRRRSIILPNLEELYLRNNSLQTLPETFFTTSSMNKLRVLHLSSNKLSDDCWDTLTRLIQNPLLTTLYLNGNQLTTISKGFLTSIIQQQQQQQDGTKKKETTTRRRRFVVCHNPITYVPDLFWDIVLKENDDTTTNNNDDVASSSSGWDIVWQPNPNLTPPSVDEEDEDDDDVEMATAAATTNP